MKIVIGSLFLTFLVFFNSIELSLQSNTPSGSGNNNNPFPRITGPGLRTITVPNRPPNHAYILPNGNYYVSRGTGPITVIYDPVNRLARVSQLGGPDAILGPGPFPEQPHPGLPLPPQYRNIPRRPPPNRD